MFALWLSLRKVALADLWLPLRAAEPGWLGLALLALAGNFAGKVLRWCILLGAAGGRIGLAQVAAYFFAGQFVNLLAPGRAGDLGRAYGFGGLGAGRTFTLGTVVIEKLLDAMMFAVLVILLLAWMPLPGWVSASAYVLVGVALAVLAGLVVVTRFWEAVRLRVEAGLAKLPAAWGPRLLAGLESLAVFQRAGAAWWLALLTAGIWGAAWLVNHLVFLALELHLPAAASLLVLVALQVGFSSAVFPGALGIFEFLAVLALGVFGVGETAAFGYGVLLHAVVLLPAIFLGVACTLGIGWLRGPVVPGGAG